MLHDTKLQADPRLLIDDLLGTYTAIVDGQDWSQWPELFVADCSYAVYSLENVERGLPLAYTLDDNRDRLRDRVKFITEVWAGTVEPYRTRHVVQRIHMEALPERRFKVRSNMVVTYSEFDAAPRVLAAGYYEDRIEITEDGPYFAERNVYLDGMPARYLVYPL